MSQQLQQELALHQLKSNDVKQFIQILTPLSGINDKVDEDVKKLAVEKLKELIPMVKVFQESPIQKLTKFQA